MNPQKLKIIISDFHLSRGKWLPDGRRNPLEDFHQDEKFRDLLAYYSTGEYENADVELVINGDFFDPLAVIPDQTEFPIEVEEGAAVSQFQKIVSGHPISIAGMQAFLQRGKQITFRWGNHDAALLWPKVQELLRKTLAAPNEDQIRFQVKPYVFDRICVDHGHQYETLNHFDENNLFMDRKTDQGLTRIQNLPFGSFFVLGFLNRIKLERTYINQVQPLRTYLALSIFVDPLFVILNGFKVAWFFIKMRFITHPMRFARLKKTFKLMGEVFHRPSLEKAAEGILTGPENESLPYDTLIMGHNHQATVRIFANGKQYINTGTWIPITSLELSNLGHRVLRTYAIVEYVDGKARASLKIWNGKSQISDDFA